LSLAAYEDHPDPESRPAELKFAWSTGAALLGNEEKHTWRFTATATDVAAPMPVPRGKVTGGTSAINGQVFLRPIPEDFERWVDWGNDAWSFQQVLPYFRKIESDLDFQNDLHGTAGPIPVQRHKIDALLPEQAAFYEACLAA